MTIQSNEFQLQAADGHTFSGYLVVPDGTSAVPGIVLLQEIFGINANMRQTAEAYADRGYAVLVPDLFSRLCPKIELDPTKPEDRARGMELGKQFAIDDGLKDIEISVAQLRAHRNCNGRVALVGYCLGGRLAFLGWKRPTADAFVCFYPVAIQPDLAPAKFSDAPLLIHLGEEDPLCPPAARTTIQGSLSASSKAIIHLYPSVGHGFARFPRTDAVLPAATIAESRTFDFLGEHLVKNKL